jgi:hypothetical protein
VLRPLRDFRRNAQGNRRLRSPKPCLCRLPEGALRARLDEAQYTELLARAALLLSLGESVVVDASWTDQHWREAAAALAGEVHADLVAVRCAAPREIAAGRLRSGIGISDADEKSPQRCKPTPNRGRRLTPPTRPPPSRKLCATSSGTSGHIRPCGPGWPSALARTRLNSAGSGERLASA